MTYILTYHDVAPVDSQESVGFTGAMAARYKLTPEAFAEHLASLAATGAKVGLLGDAQRAPDVGLTFDDGGASGGYVASTLERRGWRGHFFVTTSKIDSPGFLTAPELVELASRGHLIGSHSHTHPTYMGGLDRTSLDREWTASRDRLAEILGEAPAVASVPGGYVTPAVIESAARAGYDILLTSEPRARPRSTGPMLVMGRYAIWSTTPSTIAARYARGDAWACGRLFVEWKTKTIAKRLSPAVYERTRNLRARRG